LNLNYLSDLLARIAIVLFSRPPLQKSPEQYPTYADKISALVKWLKLDDFKHTKKMISQALDEHHYNHQETTYLRKGHGLAQGMGLVLLDNESEFRNSSYPQEEISETQKAPLLSCVYQHPSGSYEPYVGTFFDINKIYVPGRYEFKIKLTNIFEKKCKFDIQCEADVVSFLLPSNGEITLSPGMSQNVFFYTNEKMLGKEYFFTITVRTNIQNQLSQNLQIPVYVNALDRSELDNKPYIPREKALPPKSPITGWDQLKTKIERHSSPKFHLTLI